MITIEDLKTALRVDNDDEDAFIQMCLEMAEEYIISACGEGVDLDCKRARTITIMLCADMYENRSMGGSNAYSRAIATMITQLRLETELKAEEEA